MGSLTPRSRFPRTGIPAVLPAAVLAAALGACATPTKEYLAGQTGFQVVAGYVISLTDLHDPLIETLEDGVAYTVTQPGCVVVLEHERGRRTRHELRPGDRFVKSSPFSFVLLAPRTGG